MESKVRVIVRVRPFIDKEDSSNKCIEILKKDIMELTSLSQKTRYV